MRDRIPYIIAKHVPHIIAIVVCVTLVGWIVYNENLPQHQPWIADTGVVIDSGCVVRNNIKGPLIYDCSVLLDMNEEGIVRTVLDIGVLPGDLVNKYCVTPTQIFGNQPTFCGYNRAK